MATSTIDYATRDRIKMGYVAADFENGAATVDLASYLPSGARITIPFFIISSGGVQSNPVLRSVDIVSGENTKVLLTVSATTYTGRIGFYYLIKYTV